MSSSQINHVLTALPNERTLHIPIKVSVNNQIINTTAIINCGTTRNFIDPGLTALTSGKFLSADIPKHTWSGVDSLVKTYIHL